MSFLFSPSLPLSRRLLLLLACALAATSVTQGQAVTASGPRSAMANSREALGNFIDRLPDLLDLGLPGFAPSGAVRFYARPRLGDLIHEDYFRLPVGVRWQLNDELELRTELGTYFTHGLDDNVGNGFYEGRIGFKKEHEIWDDVGTSVGLDFVTPLSHPPQGITDGLRHFVPYITFTRTLLPSCGLVGFTTFGADLIDHTSLPTEWRENQLRANSLTLTVGVAREWRRLHLILKFTEANTAPLSNISQNVFGIRPSIGIPLLRRPDGTPRATATFEGRTVWGPDGFETGVRTTVRVDLKYRRK